MKLRYAWLTATILGAAACSPAAAQYIGPSTTTAPYLLPSRAGVFTASILTTGDSVNGYRMVGVPDGMGFWHEGNSLFLSMNHEIGRTQGATRANGSTGSFVSRWQIDRSVKILAGRDHNTSPSDFFTWRNGAYVAGSSPVERHCSANMAQQSAYSWLHPTLGPVGTLNRIFLNGEETTPPFTADHGRVFAHIVTGPNANKTYELPRLGKMAVETAVASPFQQEKTVVMVNDDANRETNISSNVCRTLNQTGCTEAPSELYMYVGRKQPTWNLAVNTGAADLDAAGLTNGSLYGIRVVLGQGLQTNPPIVFAENKDFVFSASAPAITSAFFEAVDFGDVSAKTGVQLQDESIANKVTQFIRVEGGAWDPRPGKERDFYFVTTGRITADATTWRPSRLWRLRFFDIANPERGGQIDLILSNQFYAGAGTTPDADPGYQMFDNITIDKNGRILLLEDVGGNNRRGRVWVYGIDTGNLIQVAEHNPAFFAPGGAQFQTNDEESTGIVDVGDYWINGWFLLNSQNHRASTDRELVEGGQLQALYVDPSIK